MPIPLPMYHQREGNDQPETQWLGEGDDDGESQPLELNRQRKPSRLPILRTIAIGWKLVILGLALYGMFHIVEQLHRAHTPKNDNSCYCGRSVAEAIASGCRYDSLATAWLPEHCRDEALSAEFERAGSGPGGAWSYYKDKNGTTRLTPSEVGLIADTGTVYYTTNEWHIVHCVYYWRKLHRTRFTGTVIERRYDNEGHIRHCGETFLSYLTRKSLDTSQGVALDSSGKP